MKSRENESVHSQDRVWEARRPSWYIIRVRGGQVDRVRAEDDVVLVQEERQRYVGLGEHVTYYVNIRRRRDARGPG